MPSPKVSNQHSLGKPEGPTIKPAKSVVPEKPDISDKTTLNSSTPKPFKDPVQELMELPNKKPCDKPFLDQSVSDVSVSMCCCGYKKKKVATRSDTKIMTSEVHSPSTLSVASTDTLKVMGGMKSSHKQKTFLSPLHKKKPICSASHDTTPPSEPFQKELSEASLQDSAKELHKGILKACMVVDDKALPAKSVSICIPSTGTDGAEPSPEITPEPEITQGKPSLVHKSISESSLERTSEFQIRIGQFHNDATSLSCTSKKSADLTLAARTTPSSHIVPKGAPPRKQVAGQRTAPLVSYFSCASCHMNALFQGWPLFS